MITEKEHFIPNDELVFMELNKYYIQMPNGEFVDVKKLYNDAQKAGKLIEENELLKHRLEVANEFIESRQEVLIPENYEDLKYILNECDLESTW